MSGMYCSNCRMDFPSGASRCPNCTGWLRPKGGGTAPVPFWLKSLEESYMQPESPVPSKQAMLEEVLKPRPRASRKRWTLPRWSTPVLALGLLGALAGLFFHLKEQSKLPDLSVPKSYHGEVAAQGQGKARQAKAALKRKDWAQALQLGQAAQDLLRPLPGTSPVEIRELEHLHQQAARGQGEALLTGARKLAASNPQQALERCREAQHWLKQSRSPQWLARAHALEGQLLNRSGDYYAARSALSRAHELDPKGGYQGALRQLAKPQPSMSRSDSTPVPAATVVVPRLDEGPSYPTGKSAVARPAPPDPQHAPVAAMPPKKAPPVHVPQRKKPPKPKKPSDQLPSYNDGI